MDFDEGVTLRRTYFTVVIYHLRWKQSVLSLSRANAMMMHLEVVDNLSLTGMNFSIIYNELLIKR